MSKSKFLNYFIDAALAILAFPAGCLLWMVRRYGIQKLPLCRRVLLGIGVFPIRNSYYEPRFDYRDMPSPQMVARKLAGINWNVNRQLEFLGCLTFAAETASWREVESQSDGFRFGNGQFETGDAEVWYQVVRYFKPKCIIEVGSGYSTILAQRAVTANLTEDERYSCDHVCVEPYRAPWLEKMSVEVIRRRLEEVDLALFGRLSKNDILFVDSSHMVRPGGDVLLELLEILPRLDVGVIVHVHDIFSPRDYPPDWLAERVLFWNEQYFLEAFLSHNDDWEILSALNFLHERHPDALRRVAPHLERERQPGSFYLRRIR